MILQARRAHGLRLLARLPAAPILRCAGRTQRAAGQGAVPRGRRLGTPRPALPGYQPRATRCVV